MKRQRPSVQGNGRIRRMNKLRVSEQKDVIYGLTCKKI